MNSVVATINEDMALLGSRSRHIERKLGLMHTPLISTMWASQQNAAAKAVIRDAGTDAAGPEG